MATKISYATDSTSGLSIIEVLVALAITSLLALALGGMIAAAMNLQSTSERLDDIEFALLRVAGMAGNFSHSAASVKTVGEENYVGFSYALQGIPSYTASLKLVAANSENPKILEASGPNLPRGEVELSNFDHVKIEVFTAESGSWLDIAEVGGDQSISGVRLRLTALSRSWFPVIWSNSLVGRPLSP